MRELSGAFVLIPMRIIVFLIHCCTVKIQIKDFALKMNNRNIKIYFKYSKTVSLTYCPISPYVV